MQRPDVTAVKPGLEAAEVARYLYCVADAGQSISLGGIGIEGKAVHTIAYGDICAVVHDCPERPYRSDNQELVKLWVIAHQRVVDTAWERWGTVLPLGFDTIIREETGRTAEQKVQDWLEQEHPALRRKIERVKGKAEYGVQLFWDPQVVARRLGWASPEIGKLEEAIKTKPRGVAYLYRQKLEHLVAQEMRAMADQRFKELYTRVKQHADDIRVEKTRRGERGLAMLANLSCLVHRDRYTELGQELDRINCIDGFSVRFTGPWPPYSFVTGAP